jgi:hypothetical protein
MLCSSCGSTLSPGQAVCPNCGTPVPDEIITPTSNNPGDDTPPNIDFGPFRETVSTPPITLYANVQPGVLGIDVPQGTVPQGNSPPPHIYATKQPQAQFVPQQPNYFPTQPPLMVQKIQPERSNRSSGAIIAILIILLALLIIGGTGLGYYIAVPRPAEFQAQATAVTQKLLATQAQGTAQAYALATATTAALTPYDIYNRATSGTSVINDPLDSKQGSSWLQYEVSGNGCSFSGGAYHIRVTTNPSSGFCIAYNSLFSNLAFQVQTTVFQGDAGGLIFRYITNGNLGCYLFEITRFGEYTLYSVKGNDSTQLTSGFSHVINTGFYQHNLLTVVAEGSHLYLYVNKQTVASVTNSNYSSGQVALFAGSNAGSTDVAFNNAQVWAL